jgi:hypothetical protein
MAYNFDRLISMGIQYEHAVELRRISMTLHRWHELECGDGNDYASWSLVRGKKQGGTFEYDEDNGKPYVEVHSRSSNKPTYNVTPDRERGALRRLAAIMKNYPTLSAYVQTDPRGCALYVGEGLTDSNYSQGVAIYK